MSSIFNRLVRVSASLTTQRPGPSYHLLQHMKWCHDQPHHYQHGIPGIPSDGEVVLLKNSNNGGQVYLVGTNHGSKHSVELVKKVINSIRPDSIVIEYSEEGMERLKRRNWGPVNVNEDWFGMFLRSMRSPGGLLHKMEMFRRNREERRLQADSIIKQGECKAALEESWKLKTKLVPIDIDDDVFDDKFPITIHHHILLWRTILVLIERLKIKNTVHLKDKSSRSQRRERSQLMRIVLPEHQKVMVDDRDVHTFTKLRTIEEKLIVAVLGMAHMHGWN